MPRSIATLFTAILLSSSFVPLAIGYAAGAPQDAAAPRVTQLTRTSYSNFLLPPAPSNNPQAEGAMAAWYGGPSSIPFSYNATSDRIGYSSFDSAANKIVPKNLTSYGGCETCASSGFPYFWFDRSTIVATSSGTTTTANAYIFNIPASRFGNVAFDTPPAPGYLPPGASSWGGFFVSIYNKLEYNQSGQTFYSSLIDSNTGSGWNQLTPDNSRVNSVSCVGGGSYTSFYDPETYGTVQAAGNGEFVYSVEHWALEGYDPSNGCVPIIVETGVDLVLANGTSKTVIQTFNPESAAPQYGVASCTAVGPCYGGVLGAWGNLVVYWVDPTPATTAYYLYDLSRGNILSVAGLSPEYFRSDGKSLLWLGEDPTSLQYNVFVYSRSFSSGSPIRQLTHDDVSFDHYLPSVAGNWASWVNTTGAVKLYLIPRGLTFGLRPWQGNGQVTDFSIATDRESQQKALFSMDGQIAVWGATNHNFIFYVNLTLSAQTLSVKAETLALTALTSPTTGDTIQSLVTSGGWVFVDGKPVGSRFYQVFAVRLPVKAAVIVIPGVAGTYLYSGGRQLWLGAIVPSYAVGASGFSSTVLCDNWLALVPFTGSNCGDRFNLLLNSAGESAFPVQPGRILDYDLLHNAFWLGHDANAYGGLEDKLTSMGYVNGSTMFVFPYDWRLDNAAHFAELDNLISRAENTTGNFQVVIIAHSMGGVISWGYLLSSWDRALRIQALVTIDTPYWGAPKVFYALVDGYGFGNPTADQGTMKIMAQNATAAYELAPRMPFILNSSAPGAPFNIQNVGFMADVCRYTPSVCVSPLASFADIAYKGFRVTYRDGSPPLLLGVGHNPERPIGTVDGLKNIATVTPSWGVTWRPSPAMVSLAQSYFSTWGNWTNASTPYVPTYAIIGTGYSTLDGYVIRPATAQEIRSGNYVLFSNKPAVLVPHFSDGDGTVPLRGEELNATDVYRLYFAFNGHAPTDHVAMVSNPSALAVIARILSGVDSTRLCQDGLCTPGQGRSGSLTNTNEKSADFVLHSNAVLTVAGESGGLLGPNAYGGIDETLPTGTFLNVDGVEYASVANLTSPLLVRVNGTGTGEFSLTVSLKGTSNVTYSYDNVTVSSGDVAELKIDPTAAYQARPALAFITQGQVSSATTGPPSSTSSGGQQTPAVGILYASALVAVAAVIGGALYLRRSRRMGADLDTPPDEVNAKKSCAPGARPPESSATRHSAAAASSSDREP